MKGISEMRERNKNRIVLTAFVCSVLTIGCLTPILHSGCAQQTVVTAPTPRVVGAGRVKVNGTKEFMGQFAPKLASLLQGDWVDVDGNTKVKIPNQVGVEITAIGGKTTIKFDQPLPIQATRGWGPFHANFSGTIEAVMEIDGQGARLQLGGLPDQILEWQE